MASARPLPIVHINGLPGTGKLTIARILANKLNSSISKEQLSSGNALAKVVHNHLLINPADAVLHRTQTGYQDLRKAIRSVIFNSIIGEPATHSSIYIFTDYQSGDPQGSSVCKEIEATAKARGCLLIPVIVSCSVEENVRRLVGGDRASLQKLTDAELLRSFVRRTDAPVVYLFEDQVARFELDVTDLTAEAAAEVIHRHVVKQMEDGMAR